MSVDTKQEATCRICRTAIKREKYTGVWLHVGNKRVVCFPWARGNKGRAAP